MSKVVVLGAGPAGLIAAHSAILNGAEDVRIFSRKGRKSLMNGAQYLHMNIPGLYPLQEPDPSFVVNYRLVGTPAEYRTKVYGPKWDGTVSPEDLSEQHKAWDIREAYDRLWSWYNFYVQDWEASPATVRQLIETWKPDLLVSTVPAHLLCHEGHSFAATKVYSTDRSLTAIENNLVICNGEPNPAWYRCSNIQGFENTEWSSYVGRPPISPMWEVMKPLKNNCDCIEKMCQDTQTRLVRGGRYGKWQKGTLSHEVFGEVSDALHGE